MKILGIETSCDETAAAIVERRADADGLILANVVKSQIAEHAPYGGVVPEIAARAHVAHLDGIIRRAMDEAGLGFGDLDGVAATAGPGLIGGLIVGLTTAKAIALVEDLPLLAINHLEGHALTARLTDGLPFPYLLLLVSGGHTQLLSVEGVGRYTRLGTTLDDALGEAFDKTAKLLGLGYPGGPVVEATAKGGDPSRFSLPRPLLGEPHAHFSFSGLKTALARTAEALVPLSETDIADLCASFQAAAAAAVADRTAVAMGMFEAGPPEHQSATGPRRLVVAGGVAANRAIAAVLADLAALRGYDLVLPPLALAGDNAAMIAWAGAERLAVGEGDGLDAAARARWPLDADAPAVTGAGVKA